MKRMALLFVTGLTSLYALIDLYFLVRLVTTVRFETGQWLFLTVRGLAALALLAVGLHTIFTIGFGRGRFHGRILGPVLLIVAVVGGIHATYAGYLSGDFEFYLYIADALLALQGALSFWVSHPAPAVEPA